MIAKIEKVNEGYIATFERHLNHSVEQVWAMLTENAKLATWFAELRVEELRKGGKLKFDLGEGKFEEMEILELINNSVFEYTWGEDIVRFELEQEDGGCKLILVEKMKEMTNHTPKDLAGWHICLDVITNLLDGKTINTRYDEWEKWFEQYVPAVEKVLAIH